MEDARLEEKKKEALIYLKKHRPDLLGLLSGVKEAGFISKVDERKKALLGKMGVEVSGFIEDLFGGLKESYIKELFSVDNVGTALNTVFMNSVHIYRVKENRRVADTFPFLKEADAKPSFHKNVVIVEKGASASILEACGGPKTAHGDLPLRADHSVFILEQGAKLTFQSYQDWRGVKNYHSRHFYLQNGASLQWLDGHTGHCPLATYNHIEANRAKINLRTTAITKKEEKLSLHYSLNGNENVAVHQIKSIEENHGSMEIFSSLETSHSKSAAPSSSLLTYLKNHGFEETMAQNLIHQDFLDDFLTDFPPEYQIEIMSHLG